MVTFNKYATLVLLLVWSVTLASSQLQKRQNLIDLYTDLVGVIGLNGNVTTSLEDATACAKDIAGVRNAIATQDLWALKMLDATSKVPSGILEGNIHDFGKYDQCVTESENAANIQGRHCLISVSVQGQYEPVELVSKLIWLQAMWLFTPLTDKVLRMTASVCLPSTCEVAEITAMTNAAIAERPSFSASGMSITRLTCSPVEIQRFTWIEISIIIIVIVWLVFFTICTVLDFTRSPRSVQTSGIRGVLEQFSLRVHVKYLFNFETKPETMPALNGIRFLSACSVVLSHRCLAIVISPHTNPLDIEHILRSRTHWTTYVKSTFCVIECFFVLSGFCRAYNFPKQINGRRTYNVFSDFWHRYVRVTPGVLLLTLIGLIVVHTSLTRTGPLYDAYTSAFLYDAAKNWWMNLFHIQNIMGSSGIFVLHTWTLAVDMQLFYISPLILYPLYRRPRCGLAILGSFFVASLAIPAFLIIINRTAVIFDATRSPLESGPLFFKMYMATYNRATAYFVGIFLGYISSTRKWHLTKTQVAINWILCIIFLISNFVMANFAQPFGEHYSLFVELTYAVCARTLCCVALAWLIFACTQGYGGFVTKFLSLPVFIPLSKLSYPIYLIHSPLQFQMIATIRESQRTSEPKWVADFTLDMVLCIFSAFLIEILWHHPLNVVQKLLQNKKSAKALVERKID